MNDFKLLTQHANGVVHTPLTLSFHAPKPYHTILETCAFCYLSVVKTIHNYSKNFNHNFARPSIIWTLAKYYIFVYTLCN